MIFGFITWITLSILCAMYASNKGRSAFGYFLLSTILSPLIGFIAVLISKEDLGNIERKELSRGNKKKCTFCAEIVKVEAVVCKHCGKDLEKFRKEEEKEEKEEEKEPFNPSIKHGKAFFIILIIFAIIMTYFTINKAPSIRPTQPNMESK